MLEAADVMRRNEKFIPVQSNSVVILIAWTGKKFIENKLCKLTKVNADNLSITGRSLNSDAHDPRLYVLTTYACNEMPRLHIQGSILLIECHTLVGKLSI